MSATGLRVRSRACVDSHLEQGTADELAIWLRAVDQLAVPREVLNGPFVERHRRFGSARLQAFLTTSRVGSLCVDVFSASRVFDIDI